VVSTVGSSVLSTVLKAVFQRARPELFASGYIASFCSFPSDHATVAVGFYGTLTLLVAWRVKVFWRWAVTVASIILVLLIGFSRMYLGVHYPTDIIAGYLAAPLWVSFVGLCYFVWRTFRRRSASGGITEENQCSTGTVKSVLYPIPTSAILSAGSRSTPFVGRAVPDSRKLGFREHVFSAA
jgi:membrane-associated phospholipid phosphatase